MRSIELLKKLYALLYLTFSPHTIFTALRMTWLSICMLVGPPHLCFQVNKMTLRPWLFLYDAPVRWTFASLSEVSTTDGLTWNLVQSFPRMDYHRLLNFLWKIWVHLHLSNTDTRVGGRCSIWWISIHAKNFTMTTEKHFKRKWKAQKLWIQKSH